MKLNVADRNGTPLEVGDWVRVHCQRRGWTPYWGITNKHHVKVWVTGTLIQGMNYQEGRIASVYFQPDGRVVEKLKKPIGREKRSQLIDDINFKLCDIEKIK